MNENKVYNNGKGKVKFVAFNRTEKIEDIRKEVGLMCVCV